MTITEPLLKIAILNMKPGVGKTTTAMYLTATWHLDERLPILIDADGGKSALSWVDMAGGIPWAIASLPRNKLSASIVTVTKGAAYGVVCIDVPQMEDHEKIAMEAMRYADVWLVPVCPDGIEVDRMLQVTEKMDLVDTVRAVPGQRLVLLNRCNKPKRTKSGPDYIYAEELTEEGWTVLDDQIPHNDGLYRQTFGTVPVGDDEWYAPVARKLWDAAV